MCPSTWDADWPAMKRSESLVMRIITKAALAATIAFGIGSINAAPAEAFYSKQHCKHYHAIKMKQSKDPLNWMWHLTEASGKRVWHGSQCKWW